MKTIVALTDFSEDAVNAVFYAADMAVILECNLVLLTVCYIPVTVTEITVIPVTIDNWVLEANEQMKQLEERVKDHVNTRVSVTSVVRQGNIMPEIKSFCNDQEPLAVIMGAESLPAFERFFTEGQAVLAISELLWPVMVIPPGTRFHGFKKMGLACDLKNVITATPFLQIKQLVQAFHAELHVLHVADDDTFEPAAMEETGWLREIFSALAPEFHFIGGNDPEKSILSFADNNDIDLLIIVPKNHSFLEKIFHHSFSKDLLLQARLPIFSIHE